MRNQIDRSQRLARIIEWLSNWLAERRGLPPMVGIGITLLGWIALIVNVFFQNIFVELFGVIFQGFGIILALIGILLFEPLGK